MPKLYEHYLNGFHQEVYDELVQMAEQVFEEPLSEDAFLIAKEMMRRIRQNIEVIVSRLQRLNYRFGEGFWDQDISPEEKALIEEEVPIFKAPAPQAHEHISLLEQLVGTVPLALRWWYEEVGSVNLVGLFPTRKQQDVGPAYGCILDPLFVYSLEMVLKMVKDNMADGAWDRDPTLALSPDNYYKYTFSGSGAYSMRVPSKTFDAPLLLERHETTFVNYLRVCFQWGGFPGLEVENRLSKEEVSFLTADLLRF